jgi:hypothetical protein
MVSCSAGQTLTYNLTEFRGGAFILSVPSDVTAPTEVFDAPSAQNFHNQTFNGHLIRRWNLDYKVNSVSVTCSQAVVEMKLFFKAKKSAPQIGMEFLNRVHPVGQPVHMRLFVQDFSDIPVQAEINVDADSQISFDRSSSTATFLPTSEGEYHVTLQTTAVVAGTKIHRTLTTVVYVTPVIRLNVNQIQMIQNDKEHAVVSIPVSGSVAPGEHFHISAEVYARERDELKPIARVSAIADVESDHYLSFEVRRNWFHQVMCESNEFCLSQLVLSNPSGSKAITFATAGNECVTIHHNTSSFCSKKTNCSGID